MRRAPPAVVVLVLIGAACGDPSAPLGVADQAGEQPFVSTTTVPPTTLPTTSPTTIVQTTAPTTTVPTTTTALPEPTMYRPAAIRSGTLVTASVMPVAGVLDGSTVTFQIVEMPDGRFLQVDRANAIVPTGAEFWTISINGRLSLKTTARQGGLNGTRIDPEVYGDAFTVSFNAVTGTDEILASTGEVQMSE